MTVLIRFFAFLFIFMPSFGVRASFDVQNDFAHQDRVIRHTRRALNTIVMASVYRLKEAGAVIESENFENEWKKIEEEFLDAPSLEEIGDHRPLSVFLDKLYKTLESVVGRSLMLRYRLTDLELFNFTIPVVFHPKGDPKTDDRWDIQEYRTHFVPFAGATAYWSVLGGCVLTPGGKTRLFLCRKAATISESGIQLVAPFLSDRIYRKALE